MLQPEFVLDYRNTPRKHYRRRMRKLKDPFSHSNLQYWREEVDYVEDDMEQEEDLEDFGVHSRRNTTTYNKPTIYSYLYLNSNFVETTRMVNELNMVWHALGYQTAKQNFVGSTIVKKLLSEAWLEAAERLKQGRQLVKLRRNMIQDVDEHNNDLANAELIFPEEVWEIILHLLTDWTDMLSCSNVCTLFQNILRPFTVQFRFPEVFACLYKYLDGAESLNCRKVCKAWCNGVDRLFENHASLRPLDDESSDPRHPPFLTPMEEKRLFLNPSFVEDDDDTRHRYFVWHRKRLCNIRSLNVMLASLPGRNPFIGRALIIDLGWEQNTAKRVLQLYGEHIWYLTVHLKGRKESDDSDDENGQQPIHNFHLEHTPNLRKLRIIATWYGPLFNDHRPSLKNLEALQLDNGCSSRFSTLFHAYHHQLKRIDVDAEDWLSLYNLGWPSLTELHLNMDNSSHRVHTVMNTEFFNSLLQANMPNLRKFACVNVPQSQLYRSCYRYTSNYYLDGYGLTLMLGIILEMSANTRLNTFRFSEYISMDVDSPRRTMEDVTVYAPLSLRTLEVEHFFDSKRMTCYSFLLHFPFLENLNVYLKPRYSNDFGRNTGLVPKNEYRKSFRKLCDSLYGETTLDSELVQVNRYLYTGEMYKSNIWVVLPHLKVLTFQLDVYTRDGYERFWNYKRSGSKEGE